MARSVLFRQRLGDHPVRRSSWSFLPFSSTASTLSCTWRMKRTNIMYHHHPALSASYQTALSNLSSFWPNLILQDCHIRRLVSTSPSSSAASTTSSSSSSARSSSSKNNNKLVPDDGLTLGDFVHRHQQQHLPIIDDHTTLSSSASFASSMSDPASNKNNNNSNSSTSGYTFHIKTYGCQMNVSDSDVVRAVLLEDGFQPAMAVVEEGAGSNTTAVVSVANSSTATTGDADILLTNTCAIREKAEDKVWQRLRDLRAHKKPHQVVGILGCMAERLQERLLADNMADVVVGPDQYRALPGLLRQVLQGKQTTLVSKAASKEEKQRKRRENAAIMSQPPPRKAINVELSLEETYDDIVPVRDEASNPHSAFVSIQRGCSNRCSFCIVPFTRGGQERSRSHHSIVDEVRQLVETQDLKEVVLLGQNVNSYHDRSTSALEERPDSMTLPLSNDGFRSRIRRPTSGGYRFVDLVEAVSDISPELRVRFTSPHPKDYPLELLQLMAERPNVCSQLHMPAQSGSTTMLKRMKRGYTREAYMELMHAVKSTIPDVALSSDFVAGFCDETEEEHADTVSLLEHVEYDQAFLFAYSMREKTHAYRTMEDNVPAKIKQRRLQELIDVFRSTVHAKNERVEVGKFRLVLVEGPTKKYLQQRQALRIEENGVYDNNATHTVPMWHGRTDQNKRILFSVDEVDGNEGMAALALDESFARQQLLVAEDSLLDTATTNLRPGDYAVVRVTEAKGHTLRGRLLWKTTLASFAELESTQVAKQVLRETQAADLFQANLLHGWGNSKTYEADERCAV